MVPTAFVLLETLPLTPNGKVDRKALPQPEGQRADLEASYLAPQNELEHKIAAILQSELHIEQVGKHDNFFNLGGNSLLLVQVQEKLIEVLNQDVPVIALFQYPTISALAHYLEQSLTEQRQQNIFKETYKRASHKKAAQQRQQQRRKSHYK